MYVSFFYFSWFVFLLFMIIIICCLLCCREQIRIQITFIVMTMSGHKLDIILERGKSNNKKWLSFLFKFILMSWRISKRCSISLRLFFPFFLPFFLSFFLSFFPFLFSIKSFSLIHLIVLSFYNIKFHRVFFFFIWICWSVYPLNLYLENEIIDLELFNALTRNVICSEVLSFLLFYQ